jgi:hypothetical protein
MYRGERKAKRREGSGGYEEVEEREEEKQEKEKEEINIK